MHTVFMDKLIGQTSRTKKKQVSPPNFWTRLPNTLYQNIKCSIFLGNTCSVKTCQEHTRPASRIHLHGPSKHMTSQGRCGGMLWHWRRAPACRRNLPRHSCSTDEYGVQGSLTVVFYGHSQCKLDSTRKYKTHAGHCYTVELLHGRSYSTCMLTYLHQ